MTAYQHISLLSKGSSHLQGPQWPCMLKDGPFSPSGWKRSVAASSSSCPVLLLRRGCPTFGHDCYLAGWVYSMRLTSSNLIIVGTHVNCHES
jgi:hypothetical protein